MKIKEICANYKYKGEETRKDMQQISDNCSCVTAYSLIKPIICGARHCSTCFNREYVGNKDED